MGVPAFFRWLSRKYPSIVVHCIEEKAKQIDGVTVPVDSTQPNPNRLEFDNLYLDMNGIIHPCCHPEDKPAPKNEDEMMVAIFAYIDRLFSIVRPRKLLYMAIDGVAPRAKMNQQRSRRFRASKEAVEKIDEMARIREELLNKGAYLPPEKEKGEHFDSNCITPGTPFMDRLAKCLHYYIHDRQNSDPAWKNIKIILSDANVPGEGEHKIMDFIRRQRANPGHNPNTHHCLCGADADLIMLGLATHEPNFTIIREEFKPNKPRPCDLCGQLGHEMKECSGAPREKQGEFDELNKPVAEEQEFIFLRLNVLREYLERELAMYNLPFQFDIERAIDDWVFMCFFVGNDFLPHLPSLEIREGAIDRLVNLYKKAVQRTGGYLTDSGIVNLQRVQLIMTELGEVEDEIFKRRQDNEIAFRERQKEKKKRMKLMNDKPAWIPGGQFAPTRIGQKPDAINNARQEAYHMRMQGMHTNASNNLANLNAAQSLKAMLKEDDKDNKKDDKNPNKRTSTEAKLDDSESEEEPVDEVRLWEDGWKDRYYEYKFGVDEENVQFRYKVAAAYTEGLCWVLRYYYQGCASWKWFFPYHYAPFASDFVNIGDLPTDFEKGTQPFKPLEQLMGVFPAASKQHLPEPWGELMCDPQSTIIDFYPDDFKIDLNGKKYAWQGVALLPFVDEKRLLKALEQVYPLLTQEEIRRNIRGEDRLYVGKIHQGSSFLLSLYEGGKNYSEEFLLNPDLFDGVGGKVLLSNSAVEPGGVLQSVIPGLPDIYDNTVVCINFRDPKYDEDYIFPAKRLPGAVDPPRVLKPGDLDHFASKNWYPQIGMAPSTQRAYLDRSGHRKLDRSMNKGNKGPGIYSNIPPPQCLLGQSVPQRYNPDYRNQMQQQGRFNNYGRYNNNNNNNNNGGGGRRSYPSNSGNQSSSYSSYPSNQSYSNSYQGSSRQSYSSDRRGPGGSSGQPPYDNRRPEYDRSRGGTDNYQDRYRGNRKPHSNADPYDRQSYPPQQRYSSSSSSSSYQSFGRSTWR